MEHLDDPRGSPKILFVSRKLKESPGTALMQQTIEEFLVTVDQGIKLMRESKHHMEVWGIDDFSPAFIDPYLFIYSLAVRAAAVAAGIAMDLCIAAVRTQAYVIAKGAGLACEDGSRGLFLDI